MGMSRTPQPAATSGSRFLSATIAIFLFVATVLVFARGIGGSFLNYDDNDYVTANEHVLAGLSASSMRWATTANVASNWHPLTWISHLADVSLFGRNPRGHHATNILLHAMNAALLFFALRRLTGVVGASAWCAALFALHPLRVESVAWVAERKDVLSGLCFVAVLWAYAAHAESDRRVQRSIRRYLVTLAAFALGLLAKPMLVTLPCVLLLLDYWPLERFSRRSVFVLVAEKLPFLLLAAISCVITYQVQKHSGAVADAGSLPFGDRLGNAAVSVVRYLGKIVWPAKLAVLYPHPGKWPTTAVAVATVSIVAITVFAFSQTRSRPWLVVGWLWFLGMLIPVIGLVQVGLQSMADRYTYLPAIGLVLAGVWSGREILPVGRRAAGTRWAAALLTAALAGLTFGQLGFWKNSVTLFHHAIAVAGKGNYLAYDNRGVALGELGKVDAAMSDYAQALAIKPDYPNANNNLARILAERGQPQEAIAHYRVALHGKPDNLEIHNNLANALSDVGATDEAIEHYQFVLQRAPRHLNARNGYAVALASKGKLVEAERELREVLKLDSDNVSAMSNLGNVCAMGGRRDEAAALYRHSLELHPDDARTLYNLANVEVELGQNETAAGHYARALQLSPLNPDAHAMLGLVLLRLGRRAEAIEHLNAALQQRPSHPQATAWLAAAQQH